MPLLNTIMYPFSYISTKIKSTINSPINIEEEPSSPAVVDVDVKKTPTEKALSILNIAITLVNNELNRIVTTDNADEKSAALAALKKKISMRCKAALSLANVDGTNSDIRAAMASIDNLSQQIKQLESLNAVEIIEEFSSDDVVIAQNARQHNAQLLITWPHPSDTDRDNTDTDTDIADTDSNDDINEYNSSFALNFNLQLIVNILEILLVLSLIGTALFSGIIFAPEILAVGAGVAALATADVLISGVSASYRFFTRPTDASQDMIMPAAQPQA